MSATSNAGFFQSKVLGHPSGLFVLFFTEMWERFSFYGMRVLLIQYLTAAVIFGDTRSGLGWTVESASALYGTYVMLLYITPVFGGIIADKLLGSWKSVILGAVIMTLGHASMAIESNVTFFIGLACLVLGTGFFKPNMPSIIGEMYKDFPEKKDGGYTIFYMGVNAGAFFGMMLCGYFAERFGWHYGFGLAGIFMLLGTIQFWLAKPLFGTVGDLKKQTKIQLEDLLDEEIPKEEEEQYNHPDEKIRNPFKKKDIALIIVVSILGLMYAFNDPISKNIPDLDMFKFLDISTSNGGVFRGQFVVIIVTLLLFFYLLISRILRYGKVVRDRMFGIIILAASLLFFFMSFEQGASSLMIVARDYVDRSLEGSTLTIFNSVNTLLAVVPLSIISWVLFKLAKATWDKIKLSNIILFICFALIWIAVLAMLYKEFTAETSEITVSWFSTLNSFFIILLASSISKIWDSKHNPSVAFKYGYGLIFVAIGFLVLAIGSWGISEGVKISMMWLVLTYLFHTIGELFISPVGLSYVSKLVPVRMLAFMYGIWYLAIAIAQKLAAVLGGQVQIIKENYSLSHFFLLFTAIPLVAAVLIMLLHPLLKKLLHGVR
ncbi:MAG: peptide MFS transporter [Crocinitomicaceae bacterium]|nr:peptide MFS transporter [Crocinitomicaceae bacterium]